MLSRTEMHAIIILLLVAVLVLVTCGCASRDRRPKTNTAAPSLTGARDSNRLIYNDVTDAKGGINRALLHGDEIDVLLRQLREGK